MNILNKMLMDAGSVAIGGHARPDGDCVGSCLGLYQYIRENCKDKRVDVYLEEIPESFQFIEVAKEIRHEIPEEQTVYDLFICLDCGDKDRLEFSVPLFDAAKHTLCVDHHISNKGFAEENYVVPDASSTSELICRLLEEDKISLETASSLYLGIVHDTGVFQYSCTSPDTMRIAAGLLEKGVDGPRIIQDTFYEKTYAQNQILGRALLESIVFMDGACIASYVKNNVMEFYGVTPKDLEGIVSQLRVTKGVEVAIFMYEQKTNIYKVSLRSKDKIDVSRIAQYFGGGGHRKAAGFTMHGSPHDVLNNLSEQIELQMRKTVE
ncbi:DHH family phosphoesterase [Faecalicatena contorta]|uniref:DHH family phosphoesterase n=1 Tax=Faecalicatena contorta TaxID=39482 RepID=UPI001F1C7225|nr:bifunctional oligoribonuclease/PAP phosphatase NrnA [Faecalicatena contorta]MCF2681379.1 bifunctional oligoribonuclease/PAP phosphatase NrnA [Faecalicatena contorta]